MAILGEFQGTSRENLLVQNYQTSSNNRSAHGNVPVDQSN